MQLTRTALALTLLSGCLMPSHEELPQGPRGVHPAQQLVADMWHERGNPQCLKTVDHVGLTDYETKGVCNGVYACFRNGNVYISIDHPSQELMLVYTTIRWLLHCTGQNLDPNDARKELWRDLKKDALAAYYDKHPPRRCLQWSTP